MQSGDRDRIVSLSKNGCIALWDGKDWTYLKTVNNLGNGMHYGIKVVIILMEHYYPSISAGPSSNVTVSVDLWIVQWWYYSSIRNSSSYQTLTSQEKVLKRGHKRRVPSCCIL
uniref:Uncharacterized protein n=1 Tax=Amphimedon queenslandica TaxID=400682 RepID=A0A1X7TE01_AMPQE